MTTSKQPMLSQDHSILEDVDWLDRNVQLPSPWQHRSGITYVRLPKQTHVTKSEESRLGGIEGKIQAAIDIGLENRKLLERLLEEITLGSGVGLGVIHSLDHGRVQLNPPLFYSYQIVDDEVVVSIEELGIHGVGATEEEAVREAQEELWDLVQDLERIPVEKLGAHLTMTFRTLRARIQRNGRGCLADRRSIVVSRN